LLERDLGIDAQREALFLFGEAVLEPPPFAAARGHSRYRPPPSNRRVVFAPGVALRTAISVSGIWGQLLFVLGELPPSPHEGLAVKRPGGTAPELVLEVNQSFGGHPRTSVDFLGRSDGGGGGNRTRVREP